MRLYFQYLHKLEYDICRLCRYANMHLHFPNPNIIFGSYKMVVCVLILFAPVYLHPYVLRVGLVWFGLGFKIFLEITSLTAVRRHCTDWYEI